MAKRKDKRIDIVFDVKKRRISLDDFKGMFKYSLADETRDYILKKLPPNYTNIVYNCPLPNRESEICSIQAMYAKEPNIIDETKWYFEAIVKYSDKINKYLSLREQLEKGILLNQIDICFENLEKIENDICFSYYGILAEMYINEIDKQPELSLEIIKEIPMAEQVAKLAIILDFNRLRIDFKSSSWQYDSLIEEHKKRYSKDAIEIFNYIDFKLNPLKRFECKIGNLPFILFFDSDFSIIDRYISLKSILPIILFESKLPKDIKLQIYNYIHEINNRVKDPYWNKLLLLCNQKVELELDDFSSTYNRIQDNYLVENYDAVLTECSKVLTKNPTYSELYIFFIKSLILRNKTLEEYIPIDTELYDILNLIYLVLLKSKTYQADRDKLLDKYYSISHLNYSSPILEFIYNEFNLNIPKNVKIEAFLNSKNLRYNSYNLFQDKKQLNDILSLDKESKTFLLLKEILKNSSQTESELKYNSFFSLKIRVGFLMHNHKYDDALLDLNNYLEYLIKNNIDIEFINTWLIRNHVKCFLKIEQFEKAADLIVDNFFKKGVAYEHFFEEVFSEVISEMGNEEMFRYISIPILLQIYNQPQSLIYDCIANFLIYYDVFCPSDLISNNHEFPKQKLIYFFEKVCSKENIEDSPYLNSIEELEDERIRLLNYLKQVNETKLEVYNEEILDIAKEAGIRRGLLQIYESRIYIDTSNIYKKLELELPEIFERYIGLDDITYSGITSLKLNEKYDPDQINITFFFKEPIPEKDVLVYLSYMDPRQDDNAVVVPLIRFTYFTSIFNSIKHEFVYNEDFGFKSFLSMRIRHGTFSNVLRSVFDKHNIISAKELDSEIYQEVNYWNSKLSSDKYKVGLLQKQLNQFSEKIDNQIDIALSWISIRSDSFENSESMFNFNFSEDELYMIFHNRIGRITDYSAFVQEVFNVLYDRLDICLEQLRIKILTNLSPLFDKLLENLHKDIEAINLNRSDFMLIEQEIVSCKTEIQVICKQITNWFKVSKNQYIEEFPISMIIDTSLDYINSINMNAIDKATVNIRNNCRHNLNGKYFESFGDMFINIFDNIISKNRDLEDALVIDIDIKNESNELEIIIKNNLSKSIEYKELTEKVNEIKTKVDYYKKGELTSSFEEGSGYLKICKCISASLERDEYNVEPSNTKKSFEVKISFKLNNLIS